jgi:hypothetical protein
VVRRHAFNQSDQEKERGDRHAAAVCHEACPLMQSCYDDNQYDDAFQALDRVALGRAGPFETDGAKYWAPPLIKLEMRLAPFGDYSFQDPNYTEDHMFYGSDADAVKKLDNAMKARREMEPIKRLLEAARPFWLGSDGKPQRVPGSGPQFYMRLTSRNRQFYGCQDGAVDKLRAALSECWAALQAERKSANAGAKSAEEAEHEEHFAILKKRLLQARKEEDKRRTRAAKWERKRRREKAREAKEGGYYDSDYYTYISSNDDSNEEENDSDEEENDSDEEEFDSDEKDGGGGTGSKSDLEIIHEAIDACGGPQKARAVAVDAWLRDNTDIGVEYSPRQKRVLAATNATTASGRGLPLPTYMHFLKEKADREQKADELKQKDDVDQKADDSEIEDYF